MKKLISVVLAFALITCGVVYYTNENNAYAVSASSNEKQLLARAVNGEARGEPYEGQVAVAAVILNRVRHSLYLQIHSNRLLSHRDIRFYPFLKVCRRHFLKLRHAPLI